MERQGANKKKISDDLITCRRNSVQIPFDLIPEILIWLPVKTLARFLCVSKEYASIIRNREFMKAYLIKSSTRPQGLIFTFKDTMLRSWKHYFFSVSQPQNRGESSSFSVATYRMNCHSEPHISYSASVHGLICHGPPSKLMVYNPSTRQSITLPKIDSERLDVHHFLGYDPISGDYKVLCMVKGEPRCTRDSLVRELRVMTLGKDNSWRIIDDFPTHFLDSANSPGTCINGILYYGVSLDIDKIHAKAVMSFDVRSEKLDLIKLPGLPEKILNQRLTSYEGKLAVLFSRMSDWRINFWVLEDAVKHEWSKNLYVLPPLDGVTYYHFHPFCVADGGEIVLAQVIIHRNEPFNVLYYNIKKNVVRRVYIEGIFTEPDGIFTELEDPLWDKNSYPFIFSISSGQIDNLMFL